MISERSSKATRDLVYAQFQDTGSRKFTDLGRQPGIRGLHLRFRSISTLSHGTSSPWVCSRGPAGVGETPDQRPGATAGGPKYPVLLSLSLIISHTSVYGKSSCFPAGHRISIAAQEIEAAGHPPRGSSRSGPVKCRGGQAARSDSPRNRGPPIGGHTRPRVPGGLRRKLNRPARPDVQMPALARRSTAAKGRRLNTEGRATLRLVAASVPDTVAVGFDT